MQKFLFNAFTISLVITMASCAKLPVQSVNLMQQIKDEGQRMHKLNIAYVNLMFDSKNAAVDSFMKHEYIPEFIGNIKKGMDANGIDMSEQWTEVFPKMVPLVNAVRDSLRTALATNKQKVVGKLNEDYEFYKQACDAQIGLLSSAAKLNNTSKQIFNSLAGKITNNKIDLALLEQKLNGFLKEGDSIAQKILFINDAVQTITGNQ
jgi:hypothetical protein